MEIKFEEFENYEQTNGFDARCGFRKIADHARATMLLLLLLLRLCALCSTAVMRRLSIDAMCVGRAVRCACDAVTRPRAQSTITFFADRSHLQQKQNSTRSTRVSMLQ